MFACTRADELERLGELHFLLQARVEQARAAANPGSPEVDTWAELAGELQHVDDLLEAAEALAAVDAPLSLAACAVRAVLGKIWRRARKSQCANPLLLRFSVPTHACRNWPRTSLRSASGSPNWWSGWRCPPFAPRRVGRTWWSVWSASATLP